jgi:hypothetical protein
MSVAFQAAPPLLESPLEADYTISNPSPTMNFFSNPWFWGFVCLFIVLLGGFWYYKRNYYKSKQ